MRKLTLVAATLLLSSTLVHAQDAIKAAEPKMPPAKPAPAVDMTKPGPELAQLKFLAASWRCDGKSKGDQGEDQTFKSSIKGKWDLKGFWLAATYDRLKSKTVPRPFTGKVYAGYDRPNGKYTFVGHDDHGGWINLRSAGWDKGNTVFLFEGEGANQMGKFAMRFSFTKGASDRQMTMKVEGQVNGQWILFTEDTCKR